MNQSGYFQPHFSLVEDEASFKQGREKKTIDGKTMEHQDELMFNLRPIEVSIFKRT